MQFVISDAAAQRIAELLGESRLLAPVPSFCDVVFDDQGSDALNSIHERVSNSGATAEEQSRGMDDLKRAVEGSARGYLWINVFEKADYDPQHLIKLGGIEFAVPLAMRSWLTDSVLVFELGRFYLLRHGQTFDCLYSLARALHKIDG